MVTSSNLIISIYLIKINKIIRVCASLKLKELLLEKIYLKIIKIISWSHLPT